MKPVSPFFRMASLPAWYDVRDGHPEIYFRILDSRGRPESVEVRATNGMEDSYEADLAAVDGNLAIAWYEKSPNRKPSSDARSVDCRRQKDMGEGHLVARSQRSKYCRTSGRAMICFAHGSREVPGKMRKYGADGGRPKGQELTPPQRLATAGKTTWNLNVAIDAGGKAWVVFDAKAGTHSNELFAVRVDGAGSRVVRLTADDGIASKYRILVSMEIL